MYNWKPWYEYVGYQDDNQDNTSRWCLDDKNNNFVNSWRWDVSKQNKVVIYGHWAADGLRIRKFTKGLDSGCVYGKRLTAYIWENWEIIQQSAFKQYVSVD
jgi:hypothetical protein